MRVKLVGVEARAYLRLGLMSPGRRRVHHNATGRARLGVVFVPGVGANGSQFLGLKGQLSDVADAFTAFEYSSLRHPRHSARALRDHVDRFSVRADRVLVVGHSLGGLLLRMMLQAEDAPAMVTGWASICAPLHGTWRSRVAPAPGLRALVPDSGLIREVLDTAHRLERLEGRILTVAARHDQMIRPYDSALLHGYPQLLLEDVAHTSALLDRRVFRAVHALATEVVSG